jgi:hypothetical protein
MNNSEASINANNLQKSLNNIPNDYEFVYFQPTQGNMHNTDLKTCYNGVSSGSMTKIGTVLGTSNVMHTRDTCKLNAGLLQSKKKLDDANMFKNVNKAQGLSFKIVSGYFNDNPKYFLSNKTTTVNIVQGSTQDFSSISSATNNSLIKGNPDIKSAEWFGYFIPTSTGDWSFGITSADSSLLWVGEFAINDYNINNVVVNNSGLHENKYAEKVGHFIKNKPYPIRIQYGNSTGNYQFQLSVKDPTGNETKSACLYTLNKADGSAFVPSVTYYSLVEREPSYTLKGLYDCYVSGDTNKLTPDQTSNCSGSGKDSNGNFIYTTANNWKKGQYYYPYRVDSSPLENQLYLGNNTDNTLMPVQKTPDNISLSNSYIKYAETYPDQSDMTNAVSVTDLSAATAVCNNDSTCKYFYFYTDNKKNNFYIKKNDDYVPKQFIPQQSSGNIKSCDLYIRNLNMNINDTVRGKIPRANTLSYDAYSEYEILPSAFDSTNKYNGLSQQLVQQLQTHDQYYGIEGFDGHGYANSAGISAGNDGKNLGNAIINKQINPLNSITQDYLNTTGKINANYNLIDQNLTTTNSMWNSLNADNTNKYDFKSNNLKYYKGVNANNEKPTIQDAMDEDVKTIILEQNTLYILGSITAASLFILAVYLGK